MSRRQVVINLQVTNSGYRVIDTEPTARMRPRPQPPVRQPPPAEQPIERRFERPQLVTGSGPISLPQPPQSQHTTLPVSTAWFDLNTVHSIEREALPEFFSRSNSEAGSRFRKSEKMYVYLRNSMVSMWRQNTKKHLPASLCRKNLLGDVCSIMRVHAFLESWGIINFPSRQLRGPLVRKDIRVECHVCSNKVQVLHTYKLVDNVFQLCERCFDQDIYPDFMGKEEFERVDLETTQNGKSSWTPSETLRLLELVGQGKGNGDWNEIAKEFPSRTKESIISYFLTLPLTNPLATSIFDNGEDILYTDPQIHQSPTVFQDYRNSIQTAATILSQLVKTNPSQELTQLWSAAQEHATYLAREQEFKLNRLTRLMIDLTMNKLQSKVVYFHDYELLVESYCRYSDQLMSSSLGDLIKEVWQRN